MIDLSPHLRWIASVLLVLMLASCSIGLTFGVFIGHAIQTTGP